MVSSAGLIILSFRIVAIAFSLDVRCVVIADLGNSQCGPRFVSGDVRTYL